MLYIIKGLFTIENYLNIIKKKRDSTRKIRKGHERTSREKVQMAHNMEVKKYRLWC